jgi:NlpB/DapX lipoprotein
MHDALRVTVVIGACIAAGASATAPKPHPVNKETVVRADFNGTWTAVIDTFSEHGWAIQNLEKDSGLITTDWMNLSVEQAEQYADCGSAGLASTQTQIRFNVRVKPDDNQTSVAVNTTFRQQRTASGASNTFDCTSRGGIEAMVHSEVANRAFTASRKPKPPAATPDAEPVDAP